LTDPPWGIQGMRQFRDHFYNNKPFAFILLAWFSYNLRLSMSARIYPRLISPKNAIPLLFRLISIFIYLSESSESILFRYRYVFVTHILPRQKRRRKARRVAYMSPVTEL
jgi:hypothetical protein